MLDVAGAVACQTDDV